VRIAALLGSLRPSLSTLGCLHIQSFSFLFVSLDRNWHGLVQFIVEDFIPRWRLNILKCNFLLLWCTLRLKSFPLELLIRNDDATFRLVSGECLSHVGVTLVLFVDEVVCCGDVVVSVGLQAPDRVFFFELEIIDESLQELLGVGHLLETREKTGLTRLRGCFFDGISHVNMVSDLRNANTRLGVCVKDL